MKKDNDDMSLPPDPRIYPDHLDLHWAEWELIRRQRLELRWVVERRAPEGRWRWAPIAIPPECLDVLSEYLPAISQGALPQDMDDYTLYLVDGDDPHHYAGHMPVGLALLICAQDTITGIDDARGFRLIYYYREEHPLPEPYPIRPRRQLQ